MKNGRTTLTQNAGKDRSEEDEMWTEVEGTWLELGAIPILSQPESPLYLDNLPTIQTSGHISDNSFWLPTLRLLYYVLILCLSLLCQWNSFVFHHIQPPIQQHYSQSTQGWTHVMGWEGCYTVKIGQTLGIDFNDREAGDEGQSCHFNSSVLLLNVCAQYLWISAERVETFASS